MLSELKFAQRRTCAAPQMAASERLPMLQFWQAVSAEPRAARFALHGGSSVSGDFVATDATQSAFHVRGLATPLGVYPSATLRSSDVAVVELDLSAVDAAVLWHQLPASARG